PGRSAPTLSRDGSTLAFIARDGADYLLEFVRLGAGAGTSTVALRTSLEIGAPALSPSGSMLAFQGRPVHDWEIYSAPAVEGAEMLQITNEIQNDMQPTFVDERTVLALKGEGRHRRSYL